MATIVAGGEAYPAAARVSIQVGCALSLQIGQKEQAIAARRDMFGLLYERSVGVYSSPTLHNAFRQPDIIAHPAQRQTRTLRNAHQIPGVRHSMVEGMHARHRPRSIHLGSISMRQHYPAGADRDQSQP